jgi:hypothetical protein
MPANSLSLALTREPNQNGLIEMPSSALSSVPN